MWTYPVNLAIYTITSTSFVLTSVANLHHSDADPHPACHFDADPDPTFHCDADPDPNPSIQLKAQNLEKVFK